MNDPPKVFVTVASKHGGSLEIAEVITAELLNRGINTTLAPMEKDIWLTDYDGVVIGSAVYMGRWLKEAKEFVQHHHDTLEKISVWLFSSGPITSDKLALEEPPIDAQEIAQELSVKDHHIFAGKLDSTQLKLSEKLLARTVHAKDGDYRDWDDIREWAAEVADELEAELKQEQP